MIRAAVIFTAILLSGCQNLSQTTAPQPEIEAAHGRLITAFSTCNADQFVAAYSDRFTFITSHTPTPVTTTDGLRKYLGSGCGGGPNPTATVKSQSISASGDTAIIAGQYLFKVPMKGQVVDLLQNFTAVMRQADGSWKVVAHHVSMVPQPAPR